MPFWVLAAIASLGGLLFGYDTGVISGALLSISRRFALSSTGQDLVTAVVLVGACAGAVAAGGSADRFGRKRVILVVAVMFVAGALISALANSLSVLILGRLVVGVAIGVASMLVPLYLAEIAPEAQRGATVSLNQFCITLGILASYLVDYACSNLEDGWRWMLGMGCVPGILLGLGMLILPESPRWLAGQTQCDVARAPWSRLLQRTVRRPLAIGVGLAVFQQITGINTVIYYAPTIFRQAGFASDSASILATAGVGVVNVFMTIVAMKLLDKVGRRVLLLTGLAGMAVTLMLLALAFTGSGHGAAGGMMALSVAAYVGSFAIGLGPVFWLLISEIFPLAVRGRGMSVASFANWGSNLLVALVFLDLLKWIGGAGVFCLFACMTLLCFVFTYRLVPETKGRSLEQIEASLNG